VTRSLHRPVSRRRVLSLLATAAGLPLVAALPGSAGAGPRGYEWRGRALGAAARLLLVHPDAAVARRVVGQCLDEVARLEGIFSLHRPDSELVRLNAAGRLRAPSHDLRIVLAEARRFAVLTDGAFDPSVQPLWRLYADHFARHPGDPAGPDPRRIEAARAVVDYRGIEVESGLVALRRPGMAVTLNGIAQGYIADRVADLLRESGFDRVLVELGETVALAPPASGRPWRVGVADPAVPGRLAATFDLADRALASSSGLGTRFEPSGRHHHLFDPATGRSANRFLGVSVLAPRAVVADALSTALSVLPESAAAPVLRRVGGAGALFIRLDGAQSEY